MYVIILIVISIREHIVPYLLLQKIKIKIYLIILSSHNRVTKIIAYHNPTMNNKTKKEKTNVLKNRNQLLGN